MARSTIVELHESCNLWTRRAVFTVSFESTQGEVLFDYDVAEMVRSSMLRPVLNSIAGSG